MEFKLYSRDMFKSLLRDLSYSRKTDDGWQDIKAEINNVIDSHILHAMQKINDEFISTHKWETGFIDERLPWEFINIDNIVCRILEVYQYEYDRGLDSYNYQARIIGVFIPFENTIYIGYNNVVPYCNILTS